MGEVKAPLFSKVITLLSVLWSKRYISVQSPLIRGNSFSESPEISKQFLWGSTAVRLHIFLDSNLISLLVTALVHGLAYVEATPQEKRRKLEVLV